MNTICIFALASLFLITPQLTLTQQETNTTKTVLESIQNGLCQIGLGAGTFANRQVMLMSLIAMFDRMCSRDNQKFKQQPNLIKIAVIMSNYICSEAFRNKLSTAIERPSKAATDANKSDLESRNGEPSHIRSYIPSLSFFISSALSASTLYLWELNSIGE